MRATATHSRMTRKVETVRMSNHKERYEKAYIPTDIWMDGNREYELFLFSGSMVATVSTNNIMMVIKKHL